MRRCAMCDEWYDEYGSRAMIHLHPEPQSGESRKAFLSSGLPYEDWIQKTPEGKEWAAMRKEVWKRLGN